MAVQGRAPGLSSGGSRLGASPVNVAEGSGRSAAGGGPVPRSAVCNGSVEVRDTGGSNEAWKGAAPAGPDGGKDQGRDPGAKALAWPPAPPALPAASQPAASEAAGVVATESAWGGVGWDGGGGIPPSWRLSLRGWAGTRPSHIHMQRADEEASLHLRTPLVPVVRPFKCIEKSIGCVGFLCFFYAFKEGEGASSRANVYVFLFV